VEFDNPNEIEEAKQNAIIKAKDNAKYNCIARLDGELDNYEIPNFCPDATIEGSSCSEEYKLPGESNIKFVYIPQPITVSDQIEVIELTNIQGYCEGNIVTPPQKTPGTPKDTPSDGSSDPPQLCKRCIVRTTDDKSGAATAYCQQSYGCK
jgi:hypothetical protein